MFGQCSSWDLKPHKDKCSFNIQAGGSQFGGEGSSGPLKKEKGAPRGGEMKTAPPLAMPVAHCRLYHCLGETTAIIQNMNKTNSM